MHDGDDLSRLSRSVSLISIDGSSSSCKSDDWTDSDMPDLHDDGGIFIYERERSPFWWLDEYEWNSLESLNLTSSSPVQDSDL